MPTFYVTMIFVKIKVRTDFLLFHTATCLTSISICLLFCAISISRLSYHLKYISALGIQIQDCYNDME